MATYSISNLAELQLMASHLDDECVLTADIDASDTEDDPTTYPNGFVAVGTNATPFRGSFNGADYTISNLYCRNATASGYAGLFGYFAHVGTSLRNGTFTGNANNWTLGAAWQYSSNVVQKYQDGTTTLSQTGADLLVAIVAGYTYEVKYTLSNYSGSFVGNVTPSLGGTALTQAAAAGTYTQTIVAATTDGLVFTPSNTARFTIDTITVYRICTFKDVNIVNADIGVSGTTATLAASLFMAYCNGDTSKDYVVFSGIESDGEISAGSGNIGSIGGIIGYESGCSITDCHADVIMTLNATTPIDAGGLIGNCRAQIVQSAANCSCSGIISVSGTITSQLNRPNIGGFVGQIYSTTTVSTFADCSSSVAILITTTTEETALTARFGGFVGNNYDVAASFTRCKATGSIVSTHNAAQAIGGFSGAGGTCSKCYATGNITAANAIGNSGNKVYVGGFSGSGGESSDCYAWGDVCKSGIAQSQYTEIGGFIGSTGQNQTDCYSTGYVNQNAQYFGGFIGNKSGGTTTTCYWDTDTSGTTIGKMGAGSASGITGLTTAQAILTASYSGFDFTSTWEDGVAVTNATSPSNLTVWLSANGDYEKYEAGTKDGDSFQLTIPSTNEIRWIESMDSLVVGTSGDEWKIGSNKLGTPLSPTNFAVKRQTNYGSALIQSVRVNEVILFIDFVKRKIREMSYDISAEKFTCPDMTSLAEHITKGQIKWISYQRNPDSMLWTGLETGEVRVFVYDREQNVLAWSKIPMAGDGSVQSGCVIPGPTEDIVYLVVNRTVAGNTIYYEGEVVTYGGEPVVDGIGERTYLEKFSPREFSAITDCFYVDCGATFATPGDMVETDVYYGEHPVVYDSVQVVWLEFSATEPVSSITGFDYLNGETVKALGDGVVLDDAIVENGGFTAKVDGIETAVSEVIAGLPYTSTVQPMRIVMGDSMGKNTKVNTLVISFVNTGAAKYGKTETELYDIDFTDPRFVNTCEIEGLYTGEITVETPGGFDSQTSIYIVSDSPLPVTIRAIIADIDRTG